MRGRAHEVPDLVRYQLQDASQESEPTTQRGEIERIARASQRDDCQECLDWTVIETRFNVVRSSVPGAVATVRRLRDYLPPEDPGGPTTCAERPRRANPPWTSQIGLRVALAIARLPRPPIWIRRGLMASAFGKARRQTP